MFCGVVLCKCMRVRYANSELKTHLNDAKFDTRFEFPADKEMQQ